MIYTDHMRTTLILPEDLIDEARATLVFTSKTDTVVYALREVVRRGRRENLKALLGRITFELDPSEIRCSSRACSERRPSSTRHSSRMRPSRGGPVKS